MTNDTLNQAIGIIRKAIVSMTPTEAANLNLHTACDIIEKHSCSEIRLNASEMKNHVYRMLRDANGQHNNVLASLIVDYCIDATPKREYGADGRMKGNTPLHGKPIDDNGTIEFDKDPCSNATEKYQSALQEAASEEHDRLTREVEDYRRALKMAINSVECASIDVKTGEELPWYKAANIALKSNSIEVQEGK
jgi:hypothetical protein